MSSGRIREFEDLREDTPSGRFGTWSLVVVGLACAGFSVLALRPSSTRESQKLDPLAELAEKQRAAEPAAAAKARADKAKQLDSSDVTFPGLLSDGKSPTTALAAVAHGKDPNAPPKVVEPPPPTDRLPVVPLPARNVLAATPVVTRPRDTLTRVAAEKGATGAEQAPAGHEGQFQLQVSSFRTRDEAEQFATELRTRGHRAYVVSAEVEGRGIWYRVRIGPFASQAEAVRYRSEFESKERVVPFVVLPPKPGANAKAEAPGLVAASAKVVRRAPGATVTELEEEPVRKSDRSRKSRGADVDD